MKLVECTVIGGSQHGEIVSIHRGARHWRVVGRSPMPATVASADLPIGPAGSEIETYEHVTSATGREFLVYRPGR